MAAAVGDILALPLPTVFAGGDRRRAEVDGYAVRWVTEPSIGRDADAVGTAVFGGSPAPGDVIAKKIESVAAGRGGNVVAYADDVPVGFASLEVVDGVARMSGGAVLEEHRGRGIYRALVAERLTYASSRGASMALTRGGVKTSSPILRGLGFVAYGQECVYRLPL